ncbi:MAG TPA: NAD(P)H-binding protein [Casimicrobiaceae bacterium]|nr:NAD(P)H-binding protein [Casimicrobiaceae bacterium]
MPSPNGRDAFVTGATGYVGRGLVAALVERGHRVTALTRESAASRVPGGAQVVIGNALDASTYVDRVPRDAVFVHLVGVSHPSPAKAREFETIDLASARESVRAAQASNARHLVYVSVAHPASVMRAYIAARIAAEALIGDSGIPATILRPWYVLGPGHRWPYVLLPIYALLEHLPATRASALRLGLVTHAQMIAALVHAVETADSATAMRSLDVPAIRSVARA